MVGARRAATRPLGERTALCSVAVVLLGGLVVLAWLRWSACLPAAPADGASSAPQAEAAGTPPAALMGSLASKYDRIRLSRLQLDKASLWMATPDWSDKRHEHFGADWYEQAWEKQQFNYRERVCGQLCVERILGVVPCTNSSLVFQAGSHLGVFPLMATAIGCQGLAIEGNPIHLPFIELNVALNGYGGRFRAINAIVGEKDQAHGMHFGVTDVDAGDGTMVPMVALDSVLSKQYAPGTTVPLGIVDVEGYEQKVLLGAADLIRAKTVKVWLVEVWLSKGNSWPGLQLLLDNGYELYNTDLQKVGMAEVAALRGTYCTSGKVPGRSSPSLCLMDHLAILPEIAAKVVAALKDI